MAIEVGGKTFRYYPRDAFYVDGVQVKEAYFNGIKYYPEPPPPYQYICSEENSAIANMDPSISYYPNVLRCSDEHITRLPDGTRVDPSTIVTHNGGKLLPPELDLPSCTNIDRLAFYMKAGLRSIVMPSCTSIGEEAFYKCTALESVVSSALEGIGPEAFLGCTSLSSIDTSKCTSIGRSAFEGCESLLSADLSSCDVIGQRAFYQSGLTSVSSPASEIRQFSFGRCKSLESVYLPNCTKIYGYSFIDDSALSDVYMPQVKGLGTNEFGSCTSLTAISLPLCIYVGSGSLSDCPLIVVDIPLLEGIGSEAFRWDTMLTSVSFPLCTYVGDKAFADCTSLTDVTVKDGCTFGQDVFKNVYPRPTVHYV